MAISVTQAIDKLGRVFTFWLGQKPHLVICEAETAQVCIKLFLFTF